MGDHVFLKVMPKRGMLRFGKRGKLSPRYIGPLWVVERVGADQLALPLSLSGVHVVFHVSMLRKYTPDPIHVVDWGELIIDVDETFFFWINKNLFLKGQSPTKNTHEVKKDPKKTKNGQHLP